MQPGHQSIFSSYRDHVVEPFVAGRLTLQSVCRVWGCRPRWCRRTPRLLGGHPIPNSSLSCDVPWLLEPLQDEVTASPPPTAVPRQSQSPASASPVPMYIHPLFGLALEDADARRQRDAELHADPVTKHIRELQECRTKEKFQELVFPRASFADLQSRETIRKTIADQLRQLAGSTAPGPGALFFSPRMRSEGFMRVGAGPAFASCCLSGLGRAVGSSRSGRGCVSTLAGLLGGKTCCSQRLCRSASP